jgi:hypothetical protein
MNVETTKLIQLQGIDFILIFEFYKKYFIDKRQFIFFIYRTDGKNNVLF